MFVVECLVRYRRDNTDYLIFLKFSVELNIDFWLFSVSDSRISYQETFLTHVASTKATICFFNWLFRFRHLKSRRQTQETYLHIMTSNTKDNDFMDN